MTGKMVEHFTGESLYKDWREIVGHVYEDADGDWKDFRESYQQRWDALAIRLNTKIHAGVTQSINPSDYLSRMGITVDADAQDTYTDADCGGPEITSLRLGSGGVTLNP